MEFYEAIDLLEEVRSVKTQTEIDHVRESNAIAEEGFEVLMQQVKNGARIRDIAISVFDEIFRNGSHFYDTSVLALWGSGGQAGPYFLLPDSDYKLKPDDMFIFSLELAGPAGYWVELSRIFCTGRPSSIGKSLSEAAVNSLENAANWLVPGRTAGDVYEALDKPIRSIGFKQGHQPGHGLGTDILESPKIREGQKNVIKENMAITLHPHVLNADSSAASYLANTYVVSSVSSQPLSKIPLDIILTQ